jgi:hypothetical protein
MAAKPSFIPIRLVLIVAVTLLISEAIPMFWRLFDATENATNGLLRHFELARARTGSSVNRDLIDGQKSKSSETRPQVPICYAAFGGNDDNDGRSWITAKGDVMACYDALPQAGGTIFISQGIGGEGDFVHATDKPGEGIWIMGGTDPNYGHPPAGWRRSKVHVSFIGVAATSQQANGHKGPAVPIGAGGSGVRQPGLWLSGLSGGHYFQNLIFAYAGRGIVIGEDSNGQRGGKGGVAGLTFENVMAAPRSSPTTGPAVDVTGGSFWIWFRDCVFDGNYLAPSISDNRHAAMLFDGTGNLGQGLIYIEDTNLNGGGIKYIPGSSMGSMSVRNVVEEGDYKHSIPPAVWITPNTNGGSFTIEQVQTADPGESPPAAVRVDGGNPGDVVVSSIAASNGAPNIIGPATVLSQSTVVLNNQTVSVLRQGEVGFANGHVLGQVDTARRNFPPSSVRFQNIAPQIAVTWKATQYCGKTSFSTTGIVAPDGTANAARAASTCSSPINGIVFYQGNRTVKPGDYLIAGVWIRSVNANGYAGNPVNPLQLNLNSRGGSISGLTRGAIQSGDGEWVWVWSMLKASGVVTSPAQLSFAANFAKDHAIDTFAPVLMHISAGLISDNEAYEIAQDFQSFPDTASAGEVSTLRNQRLSIGGSTSFFAKLTHSCSTDCVQNFPTGPSNDLAATNIQQSWKGDQKNIPLVDPTIGGGSKIKKYDVMSATIKPQPVSPHSCTEQNFAPESLSKLVPADHIYANSNAGLTAIAFPVNYRVGSPGTLAITYCNPTEEAVTPTPSTISIVAWR